MFRRGKCSIAVGKCNKRYTLKHHTPEQASTALHNSNHELRTEICRHDDKIRTAAAECIRSRRALLREKIFGALAHLVLCNFFEPVNFCVLGAMH